MRSLLFLMLFLFCIATNGQAMPIISTFDVDEEEWTALAGEGAITYQAAGGNPGGFLSIQDIGPSTYTAFPPSKFKGDLSEFDGGLLSYDIIVIHPTTQQTSIGSGFGRIQLQGGSSNATFDYAPNPPIPSPEFWKTYFVPMTAGAWHTTQANWEIVLSDVTYFDIILDLKPGEDTIGLDNFKLEPIPEPSSLLLLSSGLAGLAALRRKKI